MSESSELRKPMLNNGELDLSELVRVLWAGKWLIAGTTFVTTLVAIAISLFLPNIYRAEALLAPTDQEAVGGLQALAMQNSALAGLAGININGGANDRTALGLEILKSRKFISEFIIRHDILVPLMAAVGWDEKTGELEIDDDEFDEDTEEWVRRVRPPKASTPSMQEAYEEFVEIMSVDQDASTGFVTITIEFYSPTISREWVDWLVADLNSSIMRKDVTQAEQAINYLNDQISKTPLADLQSVFFGLIEEQTKKVMLAKMTDEYFLETIDPAVPPEERVRPRRFLHAVIGAIFGLLVGIFATLVGVLRRERMVLTTGNP